MTDSASDGAGQDATGQDAGDDAKAQDAGQDHAGDQGQDQDDKGGKADDAKELRGSLAAERKKTAALERQLAEQARKGMSDAEKAIEEAKDAGRAEARAEMAVRVVAAEFRTLAAGKLADVDAALELLDLKRFVKDDGEVDRAALSAAVDRLTPAQQAPRARVPGGSQGTAVEKDFIRSLTGGPRGSR
jgi:hypothetical protein